MILLLMREDLFLVGGQPVEQVVENTRGLARADQVAVQGIELKRELSERLVQAAAGLDVGLDRHQQPLHGGIGVALARRCRRPAAAARPTSSSSRAAG